MDACTHGEEQTQAQKPSRAAARQNPTGTRWSESYARQPEVLARRAAKAVADREIRRLREPVNTIERGARRCHERIMQSWRQRGTDEPLVRNRKLKAPELTLRVYRGFVTLNNMGRDCQLIGPFNGDPLTMPTEDEFVELVAMEHAQHFQQGAEA